METSNHQTTNNQQPTNNQHHMISCVSPTGEMCFVGGWWLVPGRAAGRKANSTTAALVYTNMLGRPHMVVAPRLQLGVPKGIAVGVSGSGGTCCLSPRTWRQRAHRRGAAQLSRRIILTRRKTCASAVVRGVVRLCVCGTLDALANHGAHTRCASPENRRCAQL